MSAALTAAVERLFEAGVMSASGHGNFSERVPPEAPLPPTRPISGSVAGVAGGAFCLTGSSRARHVEGFAVIGLDGRIREGDLEAGTREIAGMHAVVYTARPEVGAVIHTHSPHLTAFAVAGRPLPCRYEGLLRFGQAVDVPVVPWAPRGSPESVAGIAAALDEHPDTRALLLGNHGVLAFGADPASTASLIVALEEGAEAEWRASTLGGSTPFPRYAP